MHRIFTIDEVRKCDWIKFYAGHWSVFTLSNWGQHYTSLWKKTFGHGLSRVVLLCKDAWAQAFFDRDDYAAYGKHLAALAEKDEAHVAKWCRELRSRVDSVLETIAELKEEPADRETLAHFMHAFTGYGPWHSGIKP
jgi:hypothetical protein